MLNNSSETYYVSIYAYMYIYFTKTSSSIPNVAYHGTVRFILFIFSYVFSFIVNIFCVCIAIQMSIFIKYYGPVPQSNCSTCLVIFPLMIVSFESSREETRTLLSWSFHPRNIFTEFLLYPQTKIGFQLRNKTLSWDFKLRALKNMFIVNTVVKRNFLSIIIF